MFQQYEPKDECTEILNPSYFEHVCKRRHVDYILGVRNSNDHVQLYIICKTVPVGRVLDPLRVVVLGSFVARSDIVFQKRVGALIFELIENVIVVYVSLASSRTLYAISNG